MTADDFQSIRVKLLNGDTSYLGDLYLDHKAFCVSQLMKKGLTNKAEAEDLFGEAILILRKNIIDQKLTSDNKIGSYLLSICINKRKDALKHQIRHRSKLETVKQLLYENDYDTDARSESLDKMKKISSLALRSLTNKCEQILRLYYLDQMSMNDIATLMGFSNGGVAKSTKSRCYKLWIEHANQLKQKMR